MDKINEHLKHLRALLKEISIKEVMVKPVITINIDEDFSRVEEIFVQRRIRHLPVVDGNKELKGIITQRDVYKLVSPRKFFDGKVVYLNDRIIDKEGYYDKETLNNYILNSVMHQNPKSLTADKSIGEAIHIMVSHKIGCVPIINKKSKVIGILTRFDVLKMASELYSK